MDHLDECLFVNDWAANIMECSGTIGNPFVRERARAVSVRVIVFVSLVNFHYADCVESGQSFVNLSLDIFELGEVFELAFSFDLIEFAFCFVAGYFEFAECCRSGFKFRECIDYLAAYFSDQWQTVFCEGFTILDESSASEVASPL